MSQKIMNKIFSKNKKGNAKPKNAMGQKITGEMYFAIKEKITQIITK
jgi:hypothetical protein